MIQITKSQANTVILTLNENVTITSPFFLMRVVSEITNVEKLFWLTNLSSYPNRYDEFTITDNTTENANSATMNFDQGINRYWVYQMSGQSSTDYSSATLLEQGLMYVTGITTQGYTQFNYSTETFTQ